MIEPCMPSMAQYRLAALSPYLKARACAPKDEVKVPSMHHLLTSGQSACAL